MNYTGPKIDAHTHISADVESGALLRVLEERDIRVHNVAGKMPEGDWRGKGRIEVFKRLHEAHPERFAWGTTFALPRFDDPGYFPSVFRGLEEDFGAGATCCKIWRQIGMTVKKPDGQYLMVDDPYLEPLFQFFRKAGKPVLMHLSEPYCRWPSFPQGPEWERKKIWGPLEKEYGVVDFPDFWDQIRAEENIIRRHPDIRFIGAHMAGLDYDVAEAAKLLERCPNLAIDTSARSRPLAVQDRNEVRRFFIKYQDRILWGTDFSTGARLFSDFPPEERQKMVTRIAELYDRELAFYGTAEDVQLYSTPARGLDLPEDVLRKVCYENALKWFPGIFAA